MANLQTTSVQFLLRNYCSYSMDTTNNQLTVPYCLEEVLIWGLPVLTIIVILTIIIRLVFTKKHCTSSIETTSNQLTAPYCSPASPSLPTWDVFLSFYGKDTRRNFISNLYFALDQAGIQTFRDDPSLEKGEGISSGLCNAIQSSKMFVVIISENYARSSFCLDELVEILVCKRTENQVVPVFYYVDPSDLRNQKGSFGDALDFHKKRYSVNKIEQWKLALAEIADLSGYHLKIDADENESETIQEIVENMGRQTCAKVVHLEKNLFGIGSSVEEIYQNARMESNDVRAIGICGMGGIGKTTTAKAFYNKYSNKFDISCFVENVKQNSRGCSSLLSLLEQLSMELFKRKDHKVRDIDSGIRQLKQILCSMKALIVLDDLDQSSHSEVLVSICNLCSDGSRIIITTRDVNLLYQLRVDISKVSVYKVKELGKKESLELFSYHAFRKTMPPENLRELSLEIVDYVRGLPLALKVLGCSLRGRTHVSFWKAQLEKIRVNPEIHEILKLSYDELGGKTEKAIFLDIVFFFIGKDKDEAFHVFRSCGFYPEAGIPILVERCLLTVDGDNKFQMHSLIQDMGRAVILEESKHGKCRRLFLYQGNACHTLQNLEETGAIEGLILDLTLSTEKYFSAKVFERMPNLRLLEIINANDIKGNFKNLFYELRCLRWPHCPWTHLPISFRPEKLVSLDMPFNKFDTLPKGIMSLKNINYSYSMNLKTSHDFEDLRLVKKLQRRGCKSLLEVHPSIGQLTNLVYLDMDECEHLKELPGDVGQLTNLVHLDLSECYKLERLPKPIKQLTNLRRLNMGGCCNLERLPEQLGDMKGLKRLDVSDTAIEKLPDSVTHLKRLVQLKLYSCKKLGKLPEQFGKMEGLQMFDGSYTLIEQLPDSITHLKELVMLNVGGCKKLKRLPEQIGDMKCLRTFDATFSAIEKLPDSFIGLINLVNLQLQNCSKLTSLPNSIWKLKLLKVLNLNGCLKLERLPEKLGEMKCLERFFVSFTAIEKLPDSIGLLSRLQILECTWCNNLNYLPSSIGNLTSLAELKVIQENASRISLPNAVKTMKLESLSLRCNIRFSLPMILDFSSLKTLDLSDDGPRFSSTIPFSLSELFNLKRLRLRNCTSLGSIFPEVPLNLERLEVYDHATLEEVPDLSRLKRLKRIYIWRCISLQSLAPLPPRLQSLTVWNCTNLQYIPGLSMLRELKTLNIIRCSNLKSIALKQRSLQVGRHYSFNADQLNREVPEWFSNISSGCTVSFDIPSNLGDNFLGVALWVVYKCKKTDTRDAGSIRAVITNKTEGVERNYTIFVHIDRAGEVNLKVKYIRANEISVKSEDVRNRSREQRERVEDISMKSGDKIKVSFQKVQDAEVKVEMCGFHVIKKAQCDL